MVAIDRVTSPGANSAGGRVRPSGPMATTDGSLALPVKLYLLTVILPVAFTLGPLHMTLMRSLLLVMMAPLFFQLISGRLGRMYLTDWAFFAHLVWMGIALYVNNPDRAFQVFGSTGIEFLGGYLIARAYIQTRAQFITLCKWLGVIALILLPLALLETQTGRPIVIDTIRSIPGLLTEPDVNNPRRLGMERAQTVFAHPIHFGLFTSVCFSLVAVGLKDIIDPTRRIIMSGAAALCCFSALSSGAILAVLLQGAFIIWYMMFRNYAKRWQLLFWIFVVLYILIDLLSNRTPIRVFMSYATFSAHNAYWRGIIFEWGLMNVIGNAENNIPPAPFFGIGMDNWVRPSFMHSGSMDNFWLVMALRYGIPGFAFLVIGYGTAIFHIMRRSDILGDKIFLQLRRAWIFTFLGLTFTLVTVHVWASIYSFTFFMFGAGLWMITAAPETGEETPEDTAPQGPQGPRYSRFAPNAVTQNTQTGTQAETTRTGTSKPGATFTNDAPSAMPAAPAPRLSRLTGAAASNVPVSRQT